MKTPVRKAAPATLVSISTEQAACHWNIAAVMKTVFPTRLEVVFVFIKIRHILPSVCGKNNVISYGIISILQIGESEIQEGCHKRITCQPSGEVTYEFIKCNGYEICQNQNGVRGCYPAQCLIEAGASITLFSGISGGLTETGAYEIVKVCNDTLDAQWFRVVVEVLMCGETGFKGVAAAYVFYEGGIISVNRELSTWVSY